MLAITFVVASIVISCKGKLGEAEAIDKEDTPVQSITNMFAIQSKNGSLEMRMEAPIMRSYENDSLKYDLFPEGISVYGYSEDGLLETIIFADQAKHLTYKTNQKQESWSAFGNVVIHNTVKQETMETDTVYWNQDKNEFYTDCYVKMYSRDGFMQGYGMRTDDHARNARLDKPFNSYGVTVKDSTLVVIDSVNFIGPFPKK